MVLFLSSLPPAPSQQSFRDMLSWVTCGCIPIDLKEAERRQAIETVRTRVDITPETASLIAKTTASALTGRTIRAFRKTTPQGSVIGVETAASMPARAQFCLIDFLAIVRGNLSPALSERNTYLVHDMPEALAKHAEERNKNNLYNCLTAGFSLTSLVVFKEHFLQELRTFGVPEPILQTMSDDLLSRCYRIGHTSLQAVLENKNLDSHYFTVLRETLFDFEALTICHLDLESPSEPKLIDIAKRVQKSSFEGVRVLLTKLLLAQKMCVNEKGALIPSLPFALHEATILTTNNALPKQFRYRVPLDVDTVFQIAMLTLHSTTEIWMLARTRSADSALFSHQECMRHAEEKLTKWFVQVLSSYPQPSPGDIFQAFQRLHSLFADSIMQYAIEKERSSPTIAADVENIKALLNRSQNLFCLL